MASKKLPRHLVYKERVKAQEAVRVLCIEARNVLEHAREKAATLPEDLGRWPGIWLDNAIRHLDMVIAHTVEYEP